MIHVWFSSQARDVYEEAILTVVTVRDFTQVFDSYAQFEESMIAAKMETTSEMGQDEDGVWSLYFFFFRCDIIEKYIILLYFLYAFFNRLN